MRGFYPITELPRIALFDSRNASCRKNVQVVMQRGILMQLLRTINVLTLASLLILTGCFGLGDDTITPADGEDSHPHSDDNNEPSSTFFLNTNQEIVENLIFNQTTGDATVTSITLSVYSAAVDPDGDNITCGWDIDLDGNVDYPTICTGEFTNLTIPIADWIQIPGSSGSIHSIALIVVDEPGAAIADILDLHNDSLNQQNAQSTGDDTTDEMSGKVTVLNVFVNDADNFEVYFRLAAGSDDTADSDVLWQLTCDDGAGGMDYIAGDFSDSAINALDGTGAVTTAVAGVAYRTTLNATVAATDDCGPDALFTNNVKATLYIHVVGGGTTYDILNVSDDSVGAVVV